MIKRIVKNKHGRRVKQVQAGWKCLDCSASRMNARVAKEYHDCDRLKQKFASKTVPVKVHDFKTAGSARMKIYGRGRRS